MIFAETAGSDWLTVLSSVVNVGFSVIVGIYLLTKAIPKMQADHNLELSAQRVLFLEELRLKRTEFISELKDREAQNITILRETRLDFKEALKMITDHCERENSRHEGIIQVEISNLTQALEDQGKVLDELRVVLQEFRSYVRQATGQSPTIK